MPLRSRGAQPGNTNALKHGFYSRSFTPGEESDLSTIMANADLTSEITMMRVVTRRIIDMINDSPEVTTIEQATHVMGALGLSAIRLAHLMRTQAALGSAAESTSTALSNALQSVISELGLTNFGTSQP